MSWSPGPTATAAESAPDFFVKLFTGVASGDLLSIAVVGIVGLVVLRFAAARWVFVLSKQLLIFGGLALAIWWGGHEIESRFGTPWGQGVLFGGFAVFGVLLFAMLHSFFLRRSRGEPVGARPKGQVAAGSAGDPMRIGAGPLQGQGLPVHRARRATTLHATAPRTPKRVPAGGGGGGGGGRAAPVGGAPAHAHVDQTRVEDILQKINILGTSKDQNLLTVMVLILVAEFGVFTSRTIAAPDAQVGMVLFGVFGLGAVVFVKTSYKDYLTGVRHFVFATLFAVGLSIVMLVYWQQFHCPPGAGTECAEAAQTAITWSTALKPEFYFQSDGLIAAITGVAFSTLLTKGGG